MSLVRKALVLWLALSAGAMAQTSPNFSGVLGASQLNQAFSGKVDTLSGVLTAPIVNIATLNSATLNGTYGGNPVFSGVVTLSQVQSFTTSGLLTINNTGGWSSFNIGKQLYITTPTNGSNPGIGISDSTGLNPWAIYNASGGIITFAAMPALSNSTSPANPIVQISTNGVAVAGAVSATSFTANGTGGITCGPGSPTSGFQVIGGVVVHC